MGKGERIQTLKVISCIEAVTRMFEVLQGQLNIKQKAELDTHIEECKHCCDRFEFEKLFKEKLSEINKEQKAPKNLSKKVEKLLSEF
ncbi:MAG: hypothetical protein US19_C0048G0006 [Candidatus Daviesbacteria bacterium GW2011_GWB1_36_5]|uniref:Zinc-finger domain-containing protein n=1 Tax=Candidatus Daviesbacteria bacterium GW2011_GWB1_36_5 TaxID=1618426 RepID=A0A0G0H5K8_9BACT|nr:MAG: hypothetical protein US19_C0048G0006 [Candidatus Daviesbacteria bacterium GW2011_GWB1_36_5]